MSEPVLTENYREVATLCGAAVTLSHQVYPVIWRQVCLRCPCESPLLIISSVRTDNTQRSRQCCEQAVWEAVSVTHVNTTLIAHAAKAVVCVFVCVSEGFRECKCSTLKAFFLNFVDFPLNN